MEGLLFPGPALGVHFSFILHNHLRGSAFPPPLPLLLSSSPSPSFLLLVLFNG